MLEAAKNHGYNFFTKFSKSSLCIVSFLTVDFFSRPHNFDSLVIWISLINFVHCKIITILKLPFKSELKVQKHSFDFKFSKLAFFSYMY